MQELGVYVHFPFCVRKCYYCDFLSGPASLRTMKAYTKGVAEEIRMTAEAYGRLEVTSIFLGGGTPSIVPPEDTAEVMDALHQYFQVSEDAEITIECNPGTVTAEKLAAYQRAGINRLSFGLQSANEKELKLLGRIHTFDAFLESYQMAREAGFANINIDLMSALPGQTMESWKYTLERAAQLQPEHISAYSLILEPGTPFYERYGEREELLPDEDTDRAMYAWTKTYLEQQGYHRYEISNYARAGYESRHNNYYWTGVDYIGFGVGAASKFRGTRSENTEEVQYYIQNLELQGTVLRDIKKHVRVLTDRELQEEFAFLGLRRMEGISKKEFQRQFGISYDSVYGNVTARLLEAGLLQSREVPGEGIRYSLTERGIDISNVVLAEFLQEE